MDKATYFHTYSSQISHKFTSKTPLAYKQIHTEVELVRTTMLHGVWIGGGSKWPPGLPSLIIGYRRIKIEVTNKRDVDSHWPIRSSVMKRTVKAERATHNKTITRQGLEIWIKRRVSPIFSCTHTHTRTHKHRHTHTLRTKDQIRNTQKQRQKEDLHYYSNTLSPSLSIHRENLLRHDTYPDIHTRRETQRHRTTLLHKHTRTKDVISPSLSFSDQLTHEFWHTVTLREVHTQSDSQTDTHRIQNLYQT